MGEGEWLKVRRKGQRENRKTGSGGVSRTGSGRRELGELEKARITFENHSTQLKSYQSKRVWECKHTHTQTHTSKKKKQQKWKAEGEAEEGQETKA